MICLVEEPKRLSFLSAYPIYPFGWTEIQSLHRSFVCVCVCVCVCECVCGGVSEIDMLSRQQSRRVCFFFFFFFFCWLSYFIHWNAKHSCYLNTHCFRAGVSNQGSTATMLGSAIESFNIISHQLFPCGWKITTVFLKQVCCKPVVYHWKLWPTM